MRYRLLIYLLTPLALAFMWWRGRKEPAWREGWAQRWGRDLPQADDAQQAPLWIHAASVGEVNSAASLLAEVQQRWPHCPLYLTAFTPTGVARLRALVPAARVSLLPLDLPGAMARFVSTLRPRALVVLETECWPHMLEACARRNVPVIWLSGRLRASSVSGMHRLFGQALLHRAFAGIQAWGVQSTDDAERFKALGAPDERVQVTGSLKFDLNIPSDLTERAQQWRAHVGERPLWLAASTHAGEEELVVEAHQAVRAVYPDALLVLAPRHPRRRAEVEAVLQGAGQDWRLRSESATPEAASVYLVDTLGELMLFYAACDVAFVGGSLVPVGGHNLLESAALGAPVITGAYVDSCADVAAALEQEGALLRVNAEQTLTARVLQCLDDEPARQRMGHAGQTFARRNRGALARSLELLAPLVDEA